MRPQRALVGMTVASLAVAWLPSAGEPQTLGEVFRRTNPSVVVIRARGREVSGGKTVAFTEVGAGVIVSVSGIVLTAAHVVQGMDTIAVEVLGDDPRPARLIVAEPKADLALLEVRDLSRDAGVAQLADSDRVHAGEPIFVVGAPYGLRHSLSAGTISARWAPGIVNADFPLSEFFQTDAAINTGNSGGPMFSMDGEVLGIVSHIISRSGGNEGLGFVVTSNTAKRLLLDKNVLWAGIEGQVISGALGSAFKLPQAAGYLVTSVTEGSEGWVVGVRGGTRRETVAGQDVVIGGDVILKAQGIQVSGPADIARIREALSKVTPGQELTVSVLRAGRALDLTARRAK